MKKTPAEELPEFTRRSLDILRSSNEGLKKSIHSLKSQRLSQSSDQLGLSDDSARKSGSLVSNSTGSLNISDAVAISTSGESIDGDEQPVPSASERIRNMRNRSPQPAFLPVEEEKGVKVERKETEGADEVAETEDPEDPEEEEQEEQEEQEELYPSVIEVVTDAVLPEAGIELSKYFQTNELEIHRNELNSFESLGSEKLPASADGESPRSTSPDIPEFTEIQLTRLQPTPVTQRMSWENKTPESPMFSMSVRVQNPEAKFRRCISDPPPPPALSGRNGSPQSPLKPVRMPEGSDLIRNPWQMTGSPALPAHQLMAKLSARPWKPKEEKEHDKVDPVADVQSDAERRSSSSGSDTSPEVKLRMKRRPAPEEPSELLKVFARRSLKISAADAPIIPAEAIHR